MPGILEGFDAARRLNYAEEQKRASEDYDREYKILDALARHLDPDIASLGASGLLDMASGGPKRAKGLRGFMGEMDRSSYLPMIKDAFSRFSQSGPQAPPEAGSAAQPTSSPIEPERQAAGPGVGLPPGPPPEGVSGEAETVQGVDAEAEGPASGGMAGPPGLGVSGGLGPPPPPPPETPQERTRRLYPTAGEIDAERRSKELRATWNARLEALRSARTPDETRLAMAFGGAAQSAGRTAVRNAQYRTADGQVLEGAVSYNNFTSEATGPDGEPVELLKLLPNTTPRPIGVTAPGPGGQGAVHNFYDPNNIAGAPIASVPTVAPTPPPQFSGTATVYNPDTQQNEVVQVRRGGGAGPTVGAAPPSATGLTPDQGEATAWLTDVNTAVKAALDKRRIPGAPSSMQPKALSSEETNRIVQQVTKNRFKTLGELTAATKRQTVAPGGDGGGGTLGRKGATNIRRRLDAENGNTVQGSGMPPRQ